MRPGLCLASAQVLVEDRDALERVACGCLAPLRRAVQAVRSTARDADAPAPVAVLPQPSGVEAQEVQWLRRLASGTTVATLAEALGRSLPEMYRALSTTYAKLGATNRTEAVLYAARCGLLDDGGSAGTAAGSALAEGSA